MHLLRYTLITTGLFMVLAGSAHASTGVIYGVNDANVGEHWDQVTALGASEGAVSVYWRHGYSAPLLATVPLLVVLQQESPSDTPKTRSRRIEFANFARKLVALNPQIRQVVVGNEPDLDFFWSGTTMDSIKLSAFVYDALPRSVKVLGMGFSPHEFGQPKLWRGFLKDVRRYYRQTHRAKPIFDGLAWHPYWNWSRQGKIAKAMDKAWKGLPQRSPAHGLRFWWTETGMESSEGPNLALSEFYVGRQPDWPRTVAMYGSPDAQAERVVLMARLARVDPLTAADFNFLLYDARDLSDWQSGLIYANGEPKPSWYGFQTEIKPVIHPR